MRNSVSPSQWLRMIEAEEKINQFRKKINPALGEGCDPALKGILDQEPKQGALDFNWANQVRDLDNQLNDVLLEIVSERPRAGKDEFTPVTPDKLWLWGGPTPVWGGSMADDCLIREKDQFGTENAVYVYGETSDKMMEMHSCFKKLLCQVNSNCRTAGMLAGTEEENAELLSKLSLRYPNIVGAMCDDFATGFQTALLPERFQKIYNGLKKHNDLLKLYGVIYAHQLNRIHFDLIQPYIDVVNLWLWYKTELIDVDYYVEEARKLFPGKPILLGLFLHEYGISDIACPKELLIYQLERAGVLLKKNWIEGVVILGDREIRKWPAVSDAVAQYLKTDQYK